MSDQLRKFVSKNPNFFEKKGSHYVLHSDIHDLVKEYARLVNPEEFERVRDMMDTIRKDNSADLGSAIRENKAEILSLKEKLPQITDSIQSYDNEIRATDIKMDKLQSEIADRSREYTPWYYSSLAFWALAFLGVGFTYIGIFVATSGASSFLPIGAMCLLGSVWLQSHQTPKRRTVSHRLEMIEFESQRLQAHIHLLKVKRATYLQQTIITKDAIDKLLRSVRSDELKIKTLNG